ncbi:TonB-dependent receptor domain-containing protein [Agarivorans gilvus]|uniref:TonB-dependent receptor-like beta-barrel domain-containing protein n=1 Tax=Agarivorans gilvus TaxID=680279 RepID=A0ABQ1I0E8_9ALTE|nr:TonB-dependent receptor [Agarivorans gilvus]GGB02262.1 hypothetical protein GCM10007414_14440 [Agarivorans gilvus]
MASQGLELDVVAQLNSVLQVSANYTFTDAKTDETSGKGTPQAGLIPKHAASLWLDYDAYLLGVEGLNIATGLRYIGESQDNPASSLRTVPSATLWDAAISYHLSSYWDAQLNLNKLLDKTYVSGCDYYCYDGQSRSIMFATNYRW